MTRGQRLLIMKEALRLSFETQKLTYALITDSEYRITQDEQEAVELVHAKGYRVYAKCDCGHLAL